MKFFVGDFATAIPQLLTAKKRASKDKQGNVNTIGTIGREERQVARPKYGDKQLDWEC